TCSSRDWSSDVCSSDLEHGLVLVAEAGALLGFLADENVDDVSRAEALSSTVDGRHDLDGSLGAVPGFDRRGAGVAVVAAAGMGLAEVAQDRLSAALSGFADAEQRIELGVLEALDLVGGVALVDHAAALDHVGHAVAHPGFSGLAIAAGATGFLVVGLDRGRQVHVGD